MMDFTPIIQSMRGPFLVLTPVCVFLGVSTAVAHQATVNFQLLALALLGAVLAHISVNTFNEYLDFKSGLDLATTRTPFSGGSGALPGNPGAAGAVLAVGGLSLIATLAIGIFFVQHSGMGILPIGAAGLILITTYTGWINTRPFLCLIAPGFGFGFLMVGGTYFVLAGAYAPLPWVVASVPFFLVNNLLLLNQYPDIQADTRAGRRHFPIAYGTRHSSWLYIGFALAACAVIATCVWLNYFPSLSLIALLPMPLAFFAWSGAMKHGDNIGSHPQYMAANVAVTLLTPLLLGVSLMFG